MVPRANVVTKETQQPTIPATFAIEIRETDRDTHTHTTTHRWREEVRRGESAGEEKGESLEYCSLDL